MTIRIWHQSLADLTQLPNYSRMLAQHASLACGPDTVVDVHGLRPGTYHTDMAPIDATRCSPSPKCWSSCSADRVANQPARGLRPATRAHRPAPAQRGDRRARGCDHSLMECGPLPVGN
jgi:hypothetical protein